MKLFPKALNTKNCTFYSIFISPFICTLADKSETDNFFPLYLGNNSFHKDHLQLHKLRMNDYT